MVKTKKNIIAIAAIILLAVFCVVLVIIRLPAVRNSIPEHRVYEPQKEVEVREVPKYIEVERKITSEMVQESVRDMGFMVTGEYCFTNVISYSDSIKYFKPFTSSSFVASYDGFVSAGIDLKAAVIEKDDDDGTIKVRAPKVDIYAIDIDPESFVLYSEKQSFWNPLSVEDYNNSLIELEAGAKQTAIDKGLLDMAERNAEQLIRSLISSLVNADEYRIEISFE